jgi:tetratricopeptide (TPR) repeat protein
VTIPGHIYLAFALDMDEQEAVRTFTRSDDLIFVDNEAWVPVEVTLLQGDFLQAWSTGAKQWRENAANDAARIYPIRSAWQTYPPTGFASEALALNIPQTTEVVPNYTSVLTRFVEREIAPQVAELEERIERSGGSSRLINRLGTVYARYGLYQEAQDAFLRAVADDEYRPALINLGNLAFLREDLEAALSFYQRAEARRQDDPLTLISLARVHFDLSQYPPAEERYRQAEVLDPDLAQQFSYIVSENQEQGRASSAQERDIVIWDEE